MTVPLLLGSSRHQITYALARMSISYLSQIKNIIAMDNLHVRVLIIGSGSVGVNLRYHLTKEGRTDIALVEQGELTSRSTWHAACLCANFTQNQTIAQINNYSLELYHKILPQETGEASRFHRTGSVRIGFTKTEEHWFKNLQSRARNIVYRFEFIDEIEAKKCNSFMNFDYARVIISNPADPQ
jgi:dimethylglycine dehydrogenase